MGGCDATSAVSAGRSAGVSVVWSCSKARADLSWRFLLQLAAARARLSPPARAGPGSGFQSAARPP